MKSFEDSREDLLDDIHEVLTRFSGSERQTLCKQIITAAAFLGTRDQEPVASRQEALTLIHEVIIESYGDLKVKSEVEQFSLS